jgi:outer membrane immunogenic protein
MARGSLLRSTALTGLALAYPAVGAYAASAQPYSWAGFYAGLDAGYGWGRDKTGCAFVPQAFPISACQGVSIPDVSPHGGIFGAEIGENWQSQNWVFGLAGDISALDNFHGAEQFSSVDAGKADQISSRYDWLGTARGRLGYAAGPSLFYGTGGLAVGRVEDSYVNELGSTAGPQSFASQKTAVGWTAGLGWEYTLTRNWIVKAEYLHVDLGTTSLDISGAFTDANRATGLGPPGSSVLHFDNRFDLVRAGFSYKW